jgi:serine/threonine-protein kinase
MSPEQASGDVVDGRSDLYSLGLTAYFAATGTPAVTGDSTQKILVRQLTERVPPIEESRPDLPPALAAAIDRCLEKEPAARFPIAEALVEEIDAAQLAAPEIPLPIRLFAGELSALSLAGVVLLMLALYLVDKQQASNLSIFDVMLPAVVVLAIIGTRTLTTMSEGHRLATAGYSADEVIGGLGRVMEERKARRDELRADPAVRRRRRSTLIWAVAMLAGSLLMIWLALGMRTRLGPRQYHVPVPALVMIFSGFALLGTSWVLLVRSPFRMSPGERFFRRIWLGPIGRGFVRLSMRGARKTPAARRGTTRPAPVLVPAPAKRTAPPAPTDRLADLETRVGELERWRDSAKD